MATHSSVLAWRIPGMGEPGGLPSMGSYIPSALPYVGTAPLLGVFLDSRASTWEAVLGILSASAGQRPSSAHFRNRLFTEIFTSLAAFQGFWKEVCMRAAARSCLKPGCLQLTKLQMLGL